MAIGPAEYLHILKRYALEYQPDLVLVGFYVGNDIKEGYRPPTPFNKRWYALYELGKRAAQKSEVRRAVAREEFVDLTKITRTDPEFWYSPDGPPPVYSREKYLGIAARHLEVCREDSSPSQELRWLASLKAIAAIKETCDAAKIPMVLVIQPDQVQVSRALLEELQQQYRLDMSDYDLDSPQRRLKEFCRAQTIPCVDLTPEFQSAEDPDLLYLRNDNHWSARGNEVAARALAGWLRRWRAELTSGVR